MGLKTKKVNCVTNLKRNREERDTNHRLFEADKRKVKLCLFFVRPVISLSNQTNTSTKVTKSLKNKNKAKSPFETVKCATRNRIMFKLQNILV